MLTDPKKAILSFVRDRILETYDGPADDVIRAARELGIGDEARVEEVECEWPSWDEHPRPTGAFLLEKQVVGKDQAGREWYVALSPTNN